jgi:hypothetical protein
MWRSSAAKAASSGRAGKAGADVAKKLGGFSGALSEGAERLQRVVLTVKARQLAETRNAPVLKPASDGFGFSPDEIWSKNYMTVGIGPSPHRGTVPPAGSVSLRLPEQPAVAAKLQPPYMRTAENSPRHMTIGDALAKPVRRRSWLGRLLLGP